jgi:hypothetical protein
VLAAAVLTSAAPAASVAGTYFGEIRQWDLPETVQNLYSVDASPSGDVYALAPGRVYVFTAEGQPVRDWEVPTGTTGFTVDSDGNVVVANPGEDRVEKFSPEGGLLTSWSYTGAGAVTDGPDGAIWVTGTEAKLTKLSRDGQRLLEFPGYGGAIAADREDRVFVGSPGAGGHAAGSMVSRYGPTAGSEKVLLIGGGSAPGEIGESFSAEGVDVDPSGNLWVSDRPNNRIQAFTPDGRFIVGCGSPTRLSLFDGAVQHVAAGADGSLYAGDARRTIYKLGQTSWPSPTCAPPPALRVTGIRARPARFRVAPTATSRRRGTRLHLVLSEPARLDIQVLWRQKGRYVLAGYLSCDCHAGLNVVRISGWFSPPSTPRAPAIRLRPRPYVARVVAYTQNEVGAGGYKQNVLSAHFRVIR